MVLLAEEILERSSLFSELENDALVSHGVVASRMDESDLLGALVSSRSRLRPSRPFTPLLSDYDPEKLNTVGVDFRVGDVFKSKTDRVINGPDHLVSLVKSGELEPIRTDGKGVFLLEPYSSERMGPLYVATSVERVQLPGDLALIVDSRSTAARIGISSTDQSRDYLELGRKGPVIASLCLTGFPIGVKQGEDSVFQGAFRKRGSPFMNHDEIVADAENVRLYKNGSPLDLKHSSRLLEEGLKMSYATSLMFLARRNAEAIMLGAPRDSYEFEDFFELVKGNGELAIEPNRLALLATQESVWLGNVYGSLTRDLPALGRGHQVHLAGGINPGFSGTITLECLFPTPRVVSSGELACYMRCDKMSRPLRTGEDARGSYHNQKDPVPTVPKMIKAPRL